MISRYSLAWHVHCLPLQEEIRLSADRETAMNNIIYLVGLVVVVLAVLAFFGLR